MVSWDLILSATLAVVVLSSIVNGELGLDTSILSTEEYPLSDEPSPYFNLFSSIKSTKGGRRRVFAGGCTTQPQAPINGRIRCSMDSGCIATCEYDYKFPNGVSQLAITCTDKQWHILGTDWDSVPHCEPICMPECLNNGVCVAPHQCNCPEHFTGPQCQFENKPCMDYPPPVLNSYKRCNSKSCTISCLKDFTFPDGSAVTNLICRNGNWEPSRQDWVSVPDCEPVCDPPCQNGGNCLPSNHCQCPQAYRGPQCQYSADACNAEKLGFNGGFYCTSVGEDYSCTLNCPAGIEFEFTPATTYTCSYEYGVFEPQPIPQCKYSENMNIISLGSTYNSYVKETNHTWSFQDLSSLNVKKSPFVKTAHDIIGLVTNQHHNMSSNAVLFNNLDNDLVLIQQRKPRPKTCFTWGGNHYKTFDDNVFNFESDCSHILLQEARDSLFTVIAVNSPGCKTYSNCHKIINLFIQGKEYTLTKSDAGFPEFRTSRKILPIPAQLPALRIDMSAHFIVVTLDSVGVKLKWDGGLMVQIEALENMWNRTTGLCGNMNDDKHDDFAMKNGDGAKNIPAFVSSWRTEDIGESCEEYPNSRHACATRPELAQEAMAFCTKLFSDHRFEACIGSINFDEIKSACLWDYCACNGEDKRICACDTMNVYIRQCAHQKVIPLAGWRNSDTCPMTCDNGRVYMSCGPKTEQSCWTSMETKQNDTNCEEGCFCPEGTVAHEGKCIYPDECPCRLRGKLFKPGTSVPKDCNTCTCSAGKWICTQARCSARCSVVGDPHYTTFDGKHYDFMGKCKYYLMKGDNYSIEGENVPCSGAISESMGILPHDAPSCTKTVTINLGGASVKLKQNRQVLINGEDITNFPTIFNGIRIRVASSIFLAVHLPNGLEVWWDGISRVYINAPPDFHGETKGLCGTFTESQKDDFITPDGDVEQGAISFANKWKTDESCINLPEKESKHPCEFNPQRRSEATKYCSHLYSNLFSECHWHVDPASFYKDCLYDMCACEVEVGSCLCPTLAAYAKDCAAVGIKLSWRPEIDECKIHCPGEQVYQICGNSCTRSCGDISFYQDCKQECVEGCNCPEGQTLDAHGNCIPIGQCPCQYAGLDFKSGHREVRPGNKELELCTCAGGTWSCRGATKEEIIEYPAAKDLLTSCVASKNLEVTDCLPVKPRTCRNMHEPVSQSPAVCKSGCVCQAGYVLDEPNGTCVKEDSCPCHHAGQSYNEGAVIQQECNTCKCTNSKWKCTDRTCTGVCSAWGDSHYKTFDGRMFDFQGVCDYVLVKGSLSKEESFDVSIQNVPCGTTGVSCSKSVTVTVGSNGNRETIILTRGKELPKVNFKRMTMRSAGLFVFIDVPDLGLTVQWDKGTRVYVRLNPKWKTRTKGLCGDYNDNSKDDFKTPSGGISEVSPNLFGDSWKKDDYCAEPKDVQDTCEQHPERKLWAVQKCGILKSHIFHPCHSEVDVEPYLHNCVFDSCGCDTGGDCECLCTALATYAQECNARGVPIKWRTQELCPIQCDENCSSYSPCISTCPRETCDNSMTLKDNLHLCAEDTCVEGCLLKSCPPDQVFRNDNYSECIPKEVCKPFCTEIDGVKFYEGDSIKNDSCQSCSCSRGKVICKGEPCETTTLKPFTVPHEEPSKCVDGWTSWINNDPAIKGKKFSDIEPLPLPLDLARIEGSAICDKDHMVDIKCRSVKRHLTPKESGLDVECSLERGLYCKPQPHLPCIDFEISVLCRCHPEITEGPKYTTEPSIPGMSHHDCDINHPNKPHPTDCRKFYQCVPGVNDVEVVEKTCGPDMFYNPESYVCDWPANVIALRPECSSERTTPSKVEWTDDRKTKHNATILTTLEKNVITTKVCKDTETWSNCAIRCSKACQYYHHILVQQGHCNDDSDCVAGCIPVNQPECPAQKYLRDSTTCVDISDCSCKSHDGSPVTPGAVLKESECEICQCINNYYTCDKSLCNNLINIELTTEKHPQTEKTTAVPALSTEGVALDPSTTPRNVEHTVVISSTVSPAAYCDSQNFIPLIHQLKDEVSFNSSGYKNYNLRPENSVLNKPSGDVADCWEPEFIDSNQWLDIKFKKPEPIYGIIMKGSSLEDKFVTSYRVLFSEDGHTFSYIFDDRKQPRIFRGPMDRSKPVEQKFYEPIEAKIVRINPLTWHNGIAIRLELLGCEEFATSTTTPTTLRNIIHSTTPIMYERVVNPVCKDPMGLDDGLMYADQVSASSNSNDLFPNIKLSSPNVWMPTLDNPHQYVTFDFLEPRNLTGIATKGGDNVWTTAYKVYYSNDDHQWNPIIDNHGNEEEFLGNFDSQTIKTNYFEKPLHARYVKVQPIKWHEHIGLKAEILGCFMPYPISTKIMESTTLKATTPSTPQNCNVCEGIPRDNQQSYCNCEQPYWWNGESCVTKQHCPCVVGNLHYNVGAVYQTEDCQECICSLGGISTCSPQKCDSCNEPEMQSVVTELCSCICKPCPEGSRLCPTSNICINESLWCNGVQDCPDDEKNCVTTSTTPYVPTAAITKIETTSPAPTTETPQICQDPVCPPGYKSVFKGPTNGFVKSKYHNRHHTKGGVKSSMRRPSKMDPRKNKFHHQIENEAVNKGESMECQQFTCVPNKPPPILDNTTKKQACPDVICPPGYAVVYEKMSMYKLQKCPKYSCKPPPPQEVTCNVTGRTFNTFDNLEYKYDICNHILARDMFGNRWYITLEKQCNSQTGVCDRVLAVTLEDNVIVLYPDMHVDINEFSFTPRQIAKIGDKFSFFKISNIGDVTYLVSNYYGFWLIWDSSSNVKIGVSTKLNGRVDGLCGYFDGNTMNDRQMPDGNQARSTIEFGNSWAMEGVPECEPQVCPYDVKSEAWKICNGVKDRSLDGCSQIVDLDKFISRCVESTCTCLRGNQTYDDCRCKSLTNFVTECQAGDFNVDLSNWRTIHNCPVACPQPLVHKDCYRNKCEASCDNLQQLDPCPAIQGYCFPGCFCPEGTVRNGDDCVPPTQCKDCTCEWLGNSKFITFDRKNIKFSGNCTYVLSRDIVDGGKDGSHAYQVLVSNTDCPSGSCTEAITVLYKEHNVQIKQNPVESQFEVFVDGSVAHVPHNSTWLVLESHSKKELKLLIPSIQLEITSFQPNFAFTLTLPSHIFGGATEGLCGNCNEDSEDQLKKNDGETTSDMEEFGTSWLVTESPPGINLNTDVCTSNHPNKCVLPPAEEDACQLLLGFEFSQCHNLIDPAPYLSACQDNLCTNGNPCDSFEAYARKCQQMGICPIWRSSEVCPYVCPPHLEYQPCGSECKKSCDAIKDTYPGKCNQNIIEGCFCPYNHVLHNDTCIPKEKCFACDKEGHIQGDVWHPDICTTCTCSQEVVTCQKTECPVVETICEENMVATLINGTTEECCAKYLCVPKSVTTVAPICVEDAQKPECGYGQIMKVSTDYDGCKKFICECLPSTECPEINEVGSEVVDLEPGFIQIVNTSGCCPRAIQTCNPEHCPPKPDCPAYYEMKNNAKSKTCCPDYECVPPRDVCLYKVPSRTSKNYDVVPKKIGEKWMDGKCTSCVCESSENLPKSNCFTTECLSVQGHPDISDFVLEEVLVGDQCCPNIERSACRVGDNIYNVGESWQPNPEDRCTEMRCIKDAGGVQKQTIVQECSTVCEPGYKYEPSENKSVNCCGRCVPIACPVGNEVKNIGEEWYSEDHCTKHSCQSVNGSVFVQSMTEKCPEIAESESNEFVMEKKYVGNQCCPEIIKTACVYNGNVYKPGEKWKPVDNNCITEYCVLQGNVTKEKEHEVCAKNCLPGWTYEEPTDNSCCGKCKQSYCIIGDMLYRPGETWASPDNCTTYSCLEQNGQLAISSSSVVCPDITKCPVNAIYTDNCCKQCNLTTFDQTFEACAADVLEAPATIGMFTLRHRIHGICKNLEAVEGITECRGRCKSSSYFDSDSWSQMVNCQCCQPKELVGRIVELTCENNKRFKKQVAVPSSCSCEACGANNLSNLSKGTKGRIKG